MVDLFRMVLGNIIGYLFMPSDLLDEVVYLYIFEGS